MKINKKLIAPFILVLVLILTVRILWGNTALEVNEYEITSNRIPEAFSGFRIAQVSDLHNAEFGKSNERLITMLSLTCPDIIVITGDLVDSRNTDIEIALEFARQAIKISPVYYITGNHEARISEYEELKMGLEEAGVIVLENEKVTMEREGESLTMIGLDDPSFREDYLFGDAVSVTQSALTELHNESDGYTILLAHRPELFDTYVDVGVDLVFSGHAHGGQFRLPFIGGLFAPNQGLFPEYDSGLYTDGITNMLVSRGVGNSLIPLRINNRPEILVVEFQSAGQSFPRRR
ncbi:MAG: metallophosphoesterase [Oscillospiraceae bacterium]|nr:metallophosphoesterase [Oscillospiraceae bacterium]